MQGQSSLLPLAVLATAAFLVTSSMASSGLWTATTPTVKPSATTHMKLTGGLRAPTAPQVPHTINRAYQSGHVLSSSSASISSASGWMFIGAGMAFLVLAVAKVLRQPAASPMHLSTISVPDPVVAMMATTSAKQPPANLTLHVYDHCPYCTRVELFLGWNGIKYNRVLYGYGDMEGPKLLTGKKQLPVLQGDGVQCPDGMKGLPESLDIIAWATQEYGVVIPPATGRKDVEAWQKKAKDPIAALSRPRMIKMPYRDFQQPEDTEYAFAKWAKKTGFVPDEALAATPELLVEMEALLKELEGLLKGEASLNPWGLGMDDILLLPDLRRLTCVKDLKWPPKVKAYLDKALNYPAMQCLSYEPWAF